MSVINIVFATIFAVGFMALSFVLGALWCLKWYRDEEEPERKEKFFDALKKKPSKKESCAMYDESCENNNCNLCIMHEEVK